MLCASFKRCTDQCRLGCGRCWPTFERPWPGLGGLGLWGASSANFAKPPNLGQTWSGLDQYWCSFGRLGVDRGFVSTSVSFLGSASLPRLVGTWKMSHLTHRCLLRHDPGRFADGGRARTAQTCFESVRTARGGALGLGVGDAPVVGGRVPLAGHWPGVRALGRRSSRMASAAVADLQDRLEGRRPPTLPQSLAPPARPPTDIAIHFRASGMQASSLPPLWRRRSVPPLLKPCVTIGWASRVQLALTRAEHAWVACSSVPASLPQMPTQSLLRFRVPCKFYSG